MIEKKKEIKEEIKFDLFKEEIDNEYSNENFLEAVDLDILIERLTEMRNTFPNHKIQININAGNCESLDVYFYGRRLETDEEFAARKEKSRKASIAAKKSAITKKQKQIEKEKAEYERLKKIYGNNND